MEGFNLDEIIKKRQFDMRQQSLMKQHSTDFNDFIFGESEQEEDGPNYFDMMANSN